MIPRRHGKDGQYEVTVPTIADRVAQTVAASRIEQVTEQFFHPDSYGYRPGKGAHDALAAARQRCRAYDWVVDLDVSRFLNPWSHCSFVHCG